jgi:Bacteriophage protein gp37
LPTWNPWHGCRKISAGCRNCYVYRRDSQFGKDSSEVARTADFNLPVKRNRAGDYKLSGNETVFTCFTSDFFLEDADAWRVEAWRMIRERRDLDFLIITKRIDRFRVNLPEDWDDGYDNVSICCTVENQDRADYRLPIFLAEPIKHKSIICEPILEAINLTPYLSPMIEEVVVGGESGADARICNYDWVLDIREQCRQKEVTFYFKQTGAHFEKDGRLYTIRRIHQHSQAQKAGINLHSF